MPARARARTWPANRRPTPAQMLAWLIEAYDMTDAEVAGMFQVSERVVAQWRRGAVPQKYDQQIAFAYQYHHAAWEAHQG